MFEGHVDPDGLGGPAEAGDLFGDGHGELGDGGLLRRGNRTADGKRRACGRRMGFHNVAGSEGELGGHDGRAGESWACDALDLRCVSDCKLLEAEVEYEEE